MENVCCICLQIDPNLCQITEFDHNNCSIVSKLRSSVAEIDWKDDYVICPLCNNDLELVYQFREKCLTSKTLRNQPEDIKPMQGFELTEDCPKVEVSETILLYEMVDSDPAVDCKPFEVSEPNEPIDSATPCGNRLSRRLNVQFNCVECNKVFWSSIKLVAHMVKEHNYEARNVKPFPCKLCGRKFRSSSNLVAHSKFHRRERNNVCTYCGKSYIMKKDLTNHEKVHLNQREYKCDICFKGFNAYKDIRSHKLCVHTDQALWKYICEYCEKRFPIKANYDLHVRRHTDERPCECHLCHKKFLDKATLRRHFLVHSDNKDHVCHLCGKAYKTKKSLGTHLKTNHDIGSSKLPSKEKKFLCHMCSKSFIANNQLTRHLLTHTGEKPYFCTICDKKFIDKSYVKRHMAVVHNSYDDENYSNLWKYVCEVCGKRFSLKGNYDLHVKRHTDERPFECHICEKKFLDKATLRRHFLVHSDDRAHACDLCDKEYKTKRALGLHQKITHGIGNTKLPSKEKKFSCHYCSKCFIANNQLQTHLLSHTGERPYSCTICNKNFIDKSYIKTHMWKVHKVVPSEDS